MQDRLLSVTLGSEFNQIVETGRLTNFERVARRERGTHVGRCYDDSDVYKWLEAAAYGVALGGTAELRSQVDRAVQTVEAAQDPDGYIDTFFQLNHPELKWRNLSMMHEMYCGGHLIEAAVALQEEADDSRLMGVARRYADLLVRLFGKEGRVGFCGHPEIEWALIRLASATGRAEYQSLARKMVERRGQRPSPFEAELGDPEAMALSPYARGLLTKDGRYDGEYLQDHAPLAEQEKAVGHAVRAMYLFRAASALGVQGLDRAWTNLVERRSYITGGIGPAASNEGFTTDYDLPNRSAYAETCAGTGLALWALQLAQQSGDRDPIDIAERCLYNGIASGISLSGDKFFYTNPLESRGEHERQPWFSCACCPPNVARLIGSVSNFAVGAGEEEFFVNLPVAMDAWWTCGDVVVEFQIESDYPWGGSARISVRPSKPLEFTLKIRIPDWCDDADLKLPDDSPPADFDSGYASIRRVWQPGDVVETNFEMPPRWTRSHQRVLDNAGRVALELGPVVFCCEQADTGIEPQLLAVDASVGPTRVPSKFAPIAFEADADLVVCEPSDQLYEPASDTTISPAKAVFIPYFAWGNRGPGAMQVWLRRTYPEDAIARTPR